MSNPTNTDLVSTETRDEGVHEADAPKDRVQDATPEGRISDETPEGADFKSNPEDNRPNRDSYQSGTSESGTNSDEPRPNRDEDEPDTFPRAYVEKLRKENADARAKVKDRDEIAQRLHTALAAADGRLADPTDLPFSEDQLDPDTMGKAITDLVARKPHLKAIRVKGDAGQGPRGNNPSQVDLLGTLRNLAG